MNFHELEENEDFLVMYRPNIWLMDNHKWAYYCWQKYQAESGIRCFSLVHVDHHWDGGNNFHDAPEEEVKFLSATDDQLIEFIKEDNFIRYDSFIAPAIIKGMLKEVHFYCMQNDDWGIGIDDVTLARHATKQVIHTSATSLASVNNSLPLIFDLCLDLFNKADDKLYDSNLWSEQEICDFLECVKPLIEKAQLITVSLSFGYSGTEDDTRRLAKLVLPKIARWR